MTSRLLNDALVLSGSWLDQLDLSALIVSSLRTGDCGDLDVDVVALGKASREMAAAAAAVLGDRVRRRLIVCDQESADLEPRDPGVVVGTHPVPGVASLRAGRALVEFLESPDAATCTVFLISGGASSLCALPSDPLTLRDLRELWDAALASGVDITTLNKLRAATSQIAGGAVLRLVRSKRSLTLIMVDNVVSGAQWVASGFTYDYAPGTDEFVSLLAAIGLIDTPLGARLLDAFSSHATSMAPTPTTRHENRIVAQPSLVLDCVASAARERGYRVIELGSRVHGDVGDVVALWEATISGELGDGDPICVVGVGEVTVEVRGTGVGGRCQETAWSMAAVLDRLPREGVFVARSTDGRDYVHGVAGAWVDRSTLRRARDLGIDWSAVIDDHDSHTALAALRQLIEGAHTGWNLCDLYVALIR